MGFNCLKARATWEGSLLTTKLPEIRPRKDERLSRPWSHPVVLNTGPLDLESTALTTKPKANKRHRVKSLTSLCFLEVVGSLEMFHKNSRYNSSLQISQ